MRYHIHINNRLFVSLDQLSEGEKMKSNDMKTTAIIVLFVIVHLLALTSILDMLMSTCIPTWDLDYYRLNMSLKNNYGTAFILEWDLSGFSYFAVYFFFSVVDVLPAVGGILGAAKEMKTMTRVSIIIMDIVCALTLLTRFTGLGLVSMYGLSREGRLSADMVVVLGCVIALNVLIFTKQYVTQTVAQPSASAQPSRWYCHICGAENNLSNTCFKCGGIRANASPVAYSQPSHATSEKKSASKFDEIKAYKELLDSGAITQEEFDKLKAEILGF